MKRLFEGVLMAAVLISVCTASGCGQKDAAKTSAEEMQSQAIAENAEQEMNNTETEEKIVPEGTPIAMEAGAATTPSGMKVQTKICQYKVIQGVNLRTDSNKESAMAGSLFTGDVIQGTGVCENGWLQFFYNGTYCYATGSCFQETEEPVNVSSSESEETADPSPAETSAAATLTPTPEVTVDVTDWAKYTSSRWEAEETTSCRLQIHSVAGNQVIFSFQVIDGSLTDQNDKNTLVAEVRNCYGKIEHGVMNFSFTDSFGNAGVGQMAIVDERHLSITTAISQPSEGAEYSAAIMTVLTEEEE